MLNGQEVPPASVLARLVLLRLPFREYGSKISQLFQVKVTLHYQQKL
jgi:hypothetical protein